MVSERPSGTGTGFEAAFPDPDRHPRDPLFARDPDAPVDARVADGTGKTVGGSARSGGGTSPDLAFTAPTGKRHRVPARFGPDRDRVVRPPRLARDVRLGGTWRGLQVRLAAADAADSEQYQIMETEVGTALALHRAFSGSRYQGLFPVPVGYDMDAAEPFLVYAFPRGRPATALVHGISTTEQRIIERDLVLAIRLMESLGLVHRGIVPAAVWWDGERTQLWDLGSVARIGRPRSPWGLPPYASPEQCLGVGRADARDALWSTAQLMYQLVSGRPGRPDGPPQDLEAHRSLAQTLAGAFAARAEERPTPGHLLGLLMPDSDPYAMVAARPDPLEPHRREFDAALARKRALAGLGRVADSSAGDVRPPRPRPSSPPPPPGPPFGAGGQDRGGQDRGRRRPWLGDRPGDGPGYRPGPADQDPSGRGRRR